jgi:hypothetical protein
MSKHRYTSIFKQTERELEREKEAVVKETRLEGKYAACMFFNCSCSSYTPWVAAALLTWVAAALLTK